MNNRLRINIKPHNFKRSSATFQLKHIEAIKNGCSGFDFFNSDTGEFGFSVLPEHFETILNKLVENKGYGGVSYFYACCKFITHPKVEVAPEFMTQSEIAELYKIHVSRVATIVAARWLTPDHKDGRLFKYRRTEVLVLDKNPDFVIWLNNQYERKSHAST